MAIAAVPAYLGKDFSQASPGLRFGMFLPLWGVDSRSGELLWTTSDVKYEARGPQREIRALPDQNKTGALRDATKLNKSDLATMAALGQRQSALAAPLVAQGQLLTLHAIAVAPFTTGLGNEHPLENGFAFLNPYGLPYLAGSGVKGVLRQAARELAEHRWGDDQGWTDGAITALFGKTGTDGETDLQRGALMFWDVLPQIEGDSLQVEIMTPHQSHYYQNGDSPHESGQPNPINFLTVPPGSKFVFHVRCDVPFLDRLAPDLAPDLSHEGRWQKLLSAAFTHAFQWLGFGAKTAVGYGAMAEDAAARQRQEQQAAQRREATAALAREQHRAALSPEQREADDATAGIAHFRALLDAERTLNKYKPGSAFDQQRNDFLKRALAWGHTALRADAARALRESYKFTDWPSKKERKYEVKQWLTQLDGQA